MNYNPEIWQDLTREEKDVYHIYEAFQKRTSKMGMRQKWIPSAETKSCYNYDRDGKYPGDKIRESKNWQYFCEVNEIFKDYPEFDAEIFMDSVFRNLSKKTIFPAQLRTKKNVENYNEYRMKLKMSGRVSAQRKMMEDITATYKYIKRMMKKDELSSQDLYNYFNESKDNLISKGLVSCMQETISPFYYCCSKSFAIAYNNADIDVQEEIMDSDRYRNIRAIVKSKAPVYTFLKKVFGDDII